MAGITKKADAYYCTFRFDGHRYYFCVGKVSETQAYAKATEVDGTLSLIKRARLTVLEGMDLGDFVAAGGKVSAVSVKPITITTTELFDSFLQTASNPFGKLFI